MVGHYATGAAKRRVASRLSGTLHFPFDHMSECCDFDRPVPVDTTCQPGSGDTHALGMRQERAPPHPPPPLPNAKGRTSEFAPLAGLMLLRIGALGASLKQLLAEPTNTTATAWVASAAYGSFLALDLLHTACFVWYMLFNQTDDAQRHFTIVRERGLRNHCLAAAYNLLREMHAGWPAKKCSWAHFYVALISVNCASASLPPAHTAIAFLLCTPLMLYLDYKVWHHSGASGLCTAAMPLKYLQVQGIWLVAGGAVASLLQACLFSSRAAERRRSDRSQVMPHPTPAYNALPPHSQSCASHGPPQSHSQDSLAATDQGAAACVTWHPSALPFQTFPIPLLSAWVRSRMFQQLEPWLLDSCDKLNLDVESIMAIVCLPVVLYYGIRLQMARVVSSQLLDDISADEWHLVLTLSILLGRSLKHMETSGFTHMFQSRMQRSVRALLDVFPRHVVEWLLSEDVPHTPGPSQAPSVQPGSSRNNIKLRLETQEDLLAREQQQGQQQPQQQSQREQQQHQRAGESTAASTAAVPATATAAFDPAPLSCPPPTPAPSRTSSSSLRSLPPAAAPPPSPSSLLRAPHLIGSESVAQSHACVTVMFSDLVGFSSWAHHSSPDEVMGTLNRLYTRLDTILLQEMPSLYKVETIGDAYVVAANLVSEDPRHAATAVRFALRAQEEAAKVPQPNSATGASLQMRIGLHSGPVMSGVIGLLRRRFCMFGDTVNLCARTETSCPPGCVQLTASTHVLAAPHLEAEVELVERGEVRVKGADAPLNMFLARWRRPGGDATNMLDACPAPLALDT